jgi:hypothetical protein
LWAHWAPAMAACATGTLLARRARRSRRVGSSSARTASAECFPSSIRSFATRPTLAQRNGRVTGADLRRRRARPARSVARASATAGARRRRLRPLADGVTSAGVRLPGPVAVAMQPQRQPPSGRDREKLCGRLDRFSAAIAQSAVARILDRIVPNRGRQSPPPRVVACEPGSTLSVQHRTRMLCRGVPLSQHDRRAISDVTRPLLPRQLAAPVAAAPRTSCQP